MAEPTYPHNIDKDYVWWLEDDQIAIAYIKDTVTVDSTGTYPRNRTTMGEFLSPHEVTDIRIHVVKQAGKVGQEGSAGGLTSMTDIPEFPSRFHEALVYYAIARGYERSAEGFEKGGYFKAEYLKEVGEAIKYKNQRRYGGLRTVSVNKKTGIL